MNNIDQKYFGHIIKNVNSVGTTYSPFVKTSLKELENSINNLEDSKIKTIYRFENKNDLDLIYINNILEYLESGEINEKQFLDAVEDPKPKA